MTNFPSGLFPPFPVISTVSNIDIDLNVISATSVSSAAFPSANRAYYIPILVPYAVVVTKLFCINGGTAGNNFDIGIYDVAGTKIVSTGSTAQSGTSQVQTVDITDTILGPGLFYMALACNGTSATFAVWSSGGTRFMNAIGAFTQSTAFALPATATFATAASFYIPIIGFIVAPTTLI